MHSGEVMRGVSFAEDAHKLMQSVDNASTLFANVLSGFLTWSPRWAP